MCWQTETLPSVGIFSLIAIFLQIKCLIIFSFFSLILMILIKPDDNPGCDLFKPVWHRDQVLVSMTTSGPKNSCVSVCWGTCFLSSVWVRRGADANVFSDTFSYRTHVCKYCVTWNLSCSWVWTYTAVKHRQYVELLCTALDHSMFTWWLLSLLLIIMLFHWMHFNK